MHVYVTEKIISSSVHVSHLVFSNARETRVLIISAKSSYVAFLASTVMLLIKICKLVLQKIILKCVNRTSIRTDKRTDNIPLLCYMYMYIDEVWLR